MDSNESLCNKHQDKTVVCNDAFNVSLHLWDEPSSHLICNHFFSGWRKVVLQTQIFFSGLKKVVDQKKMWIYIINPHFFWLEKSGSANSDWFFFWFEKSEKKIVFEEPFIEPLFFTFLEKWLQIKWLSRNRVNLIRSYNSFQKTAVAKSFLF